MTSIRVHDWLLRVDLEATKQAYAQKADCCLCAECQNFRYVTEQMSEGIIKSAATLGIDLLNPCRISAFEVEGDNIMYAGHYCVQGEIIEGELDAWDIVVGDHCFSLMNEGDITKPFNGKTFEIAFEVVLPKVAVME